VLTERLRSLVGRRPAGSAAGDSEAKDGLLQRARQRNPLGADGALTRAAERIPLVNNFVQGVHRARGWDSQLERARKRNPFGVDGYMTKFGEHIPFVADGIKAIHKLRGNSEAEERARAFSIGRMLSKDGAITKVAELLPISNIVVAALMEIKGEHAEAEKALDILGNWREIGDADGALARVAELLPGVDIVAFGFMVNRGRYASALRTLTKTRWVDITADCVALVLQSGRFEDWLVLEMDSDLEVHPKAASLSGGLLDLCMNLLDFTKQGEPRWIKPPWRRLSTSTTEQADDVRQRFGMRGVAQSMKITKANEVLSMVLAAIENNTPEVLGWTIDLFNWSRDEWVPATRSSRKIMRVMRVFLPDMVNPPAPSSGASLIEAIQRSLPDVTMRHGPMPRRRLSEPQRGRLKHRIPETCGAVSCVSCLSMAACGAHLGPLACLSGCIAAAAALHRTVKSNLIRWINRSNETVWEWMSAPVVPLDLQDPPPMVHPPRPKLFSQRHSTASSSAMPGRPPSCCSPSSAKTPEAEEEQPGQARGDVHSEAPREDDLPTGVIFDWPPEHVVPGSEFVRGYILEEFLRRHWLGWLLWFFEEQIFLNFLNDAVGGQVVPVAIPIPISQGRYSAIDMWLPEIRVLLLLEFCFVDRHYLTGVTVGVVDGLLDQIANAVKAQSLPKDLRELDARLGDFTEPVELHFDISLQWPQEERLRVELRDVMTSLHLPQ